MHCGNCGFENPEGMKFCGECAAPLKQRCFQCGFENPPGFKFCGECGTPLTRQSPVASSQLSVISSRSPAPSPIVYTPPYLAERILAEQAAMEARGARDGERKTITALFADIKDSTALIEDLDPEEARRILDPALQLMMDAVHRYEGYVSQSLGDGIFALFGAPLAHEDHAQRAIYAALRMQEDSQRYAEQLRRAHGINLQVRIGLNSGEVVARAIRKDDLHADYVPVGHTTNLASRMESLAAGGTIVVSEHTYKLSEGYFEFRSLGEVKVKGVSAPIHIYEVVGFGPLRTRLQVSTRRGLSRFVGRQSDLAHMQRALDLAKEGHGQIVGVVGEPGVGKSRLFYEFKRLSQRGALVLEAFCVSYGKGYAYLPLIEFLHTYFDITQQDDERRRREKVAGKVLMLDRALEGILPYLFSLLGIAEPSATLQPMDPHIRKRRTLEAIKQLLLRESLNHPLLVIFEDLHWLDAETQAFLSLLSESLASAKIVLLVNYRPEYRHEWGSKTYYTQLRLDPLGHEEAQALLTTLLGDSALVQPLKQFILEKTEGNPFFMEEIVQALVEQGTLLRDPAGGASLTPSLLMNLAEIRLPTTVQGILAARMDRLPPREKELLQTLAVIGKEFSSSVLRAVAGQRDEEIQELLAHLQAAEFLYEQPAFPEPEYTFKHVLTQEVAYNSLLQDQCRALHERTAQAIERLFHSRLEDHYSDLAHHYSRSGNTHKAVEYLQRAAQQAVQRSAHAEAMSSLTIALELLTTLPDEPERPRREISLQIALAASLQATKGPAAPEVEHAYTRARILCQHVDEPRQLFSALRGLWVWHHVRADLSAARELGEQLLTMAERVQDSALLLEAHRALGSTLLWQGEFPLARIHLEQSIALYDPQQHRFLMALHGGADPGVSCLCEVARVLWFLGHPDQALQRSQDALTLAEKLSDPFSLGFALVFAAGIHQFRREGPETQQRAEAGIALAREQEFTPLISAGTIRRGWALVEQGQTEEGLAQMHEGLSARRTAGAELAEPYFLALQAEVYGKMGQTTQALTLLTKALAGIHATGEHRLEAELYRLNGELLLQQFHVSGSTFQIQENQAEVYFQQAIDIAQRQSAKSLELRAVMSLSRLRQQQGKKEDARPMLAEVYDWFTEGFETADLQEAKTLLQELA